MAKKSEGVKKKTINDSGSFFTKHFYELIIVVFSFLLFANSIGNGYNMDDELVTSNHKLTSKGISAIPEIFSSPYYSDASGYAYEYRPVVLTSFAIENSLFGDHAGVSHFISCLLYAFCVWLVYKLMLQLLVGVSPLLSFALAMLFAAHPVHTEVVCSIKNRDEILGLIFVLLALHFTLKAVKLNKWPWLILTGGLFLLALMCKITFISFAVIIPMLAVFFSPISLRTLSLLVVLIVIPSYLMLDVLSFYIKVVVLAGVVSGSFFFYILCRPAATNAAWQTLKQGILQLPGQISQSSIDATPFTGFKSIVGNLLPPASYFSFRAIIIPALLFIAYLGGLKLQFSYMLFALPLVLFLLSFSGNPARTYWAKLFLYACLGVGGSAFLLGNTPHMYMQIIWGVLVPLFLYEIFFNKSGLAIPAFVFLAGLCAALLSSRTIGYGPFDFAITILFFGLLRWQKGKVGVLIIVALSLISIANQVGYMFKPQTFETSGNLLPYTRLLFGAFIYFKRSPRLIADAFTLLAIFIVGLFYSSARIDLKQKIEATGKIVDVNLYKVKADRPLSYIENPLVGEVSSQTRAGTVLNILLFYLQKVILPYQFAFYYGYQFIKPQPLSSPGAIISLLLHSILLLLALALARKDKLLSAGIWVYLISVAIYSNFVLPPPGIVADRFIFIPSLGFCMVLAAICYRAFERLNPGKEFSMLFVPKGMKYAFVVLLAGYSVITFSRNLDWKDHLTLMRHDIKYVNESAQANNLLALNIMKYSLTPMVLSEQQQLWNEAIIHFKKSLEIYPNTFNIAYDIGRVYTALKQTDSSLHYFKLAEQISPNHKLPVLNTNIAMGYSQLGLTDSANIYLEKYIKAKPSDFEGYNSLALSYFRSNNILKSIEVSRRAYAALPSNYRAPYNIAQAYAAINQRDSALYYLMLAQKLNTGNDPNVAQAIQRLSQPIK